MYKCCGNCDHSECTNIEDLFFKCKIRGCNVESYQEPCKDYKQDVLILLKEQGNGTTK